MKRQPMTLDDEALERLGAFIGAWVEGKTEQRLRAWQKVGVLHTLYGSGNPRRELVRLGYLLTSAAAQPAIVDGWRVMRKRDTAERGHFYRLERAEAVAKREAEAETENGRQQRRERRRTAGNEGPPHQIGLGLAARLVSNVAAPGPTSQRRLVYDISSTSPMFEDRVRITLILSERDAFNYSRCSRTVVYEALRAIMTPAIDAAPEELEPGPTKTVTESLPATMRPGGS